MGVEVGVGWRAMEHLIGREGGYERSGEPQSEPESTLKAVEAVNKHCKHRLCFFGWGEGVSSVCCWVMARIRPVPSYSSWSPG